MSAYVRASTKLWVGELKNFEREPSAAKGVKIRLCQASAALTDNVVHVMCARCVCNRMHHTEHRVVTSKTAYLLARYAAPIFARHCLDACMHKLDNVSHMVMRCLPVPLMHAPRSMVVAVCQCMHGYPTHNITQPARHTDKLL